VTVIADSGTFKFLVRTCGPDALLELMEMGALEILYFDNGTAVVTVQLSDGGDCNDYGNYTALPTSIFLRQTSNTTKPCPLPTVPFQRRTS
ncbi:MAG: hypothetical protein WB593_12935, partial [Candidatus Sulfotelmatobacter sp.]